MTGSHRAAAALLAGLLLVAGAWVEWRPGALSATAVAVGMIAVHAYGLTVLGTSLSSIENSHVRRLARSFLWIVPPLMLVIVAQNAAVALGWAPAVLREFPVAQLLYLLVTECLLLVYGLLYLFKQEPASACTLPDPFVQNYSISPRECEIISMIVQGYGNRMIGEKLYISAMTVKNHIYHIYQKTSAGNKVQLINLINSLK